MNDPKLKITLELSGQEKIEEFLAKLNKKYHLAADADFSNIAHEIQKNIESPLNKQISAFNSFKTKAMQFGLVMNGVSGAISGAMMLYKATIGAVVDSAAEFEQLKLRLASLYQDTNKAAAAFEKFRTIASNTPATLKGVTLGLVSFSSVMKALGASKMARLRSQLKVESGYMNTLCGFPSTLNPKTLKLYNSTTLQLSTGRCPSTLN
jgi:phage tail tape-measure protein